MPQAADQERLAKEAEERIETQEREWLAKKPRHEELDLITLTDEVSAEAASLSIALQNISQTPQAKRPADAEAFVFEEDAKDQAQVEQLREKLQALKVVARAKVTENRVYSAVFHPDCTKDLIFFGGS